MILAGCGRIGFDPSSATSDGAAGTSDGSGPVGPFGDFGTPVAQTALYSPEVDYGPCLSSDGLELYFTSERPPTLGYGDLWRATRLDRSSEFSNLEVLPALSSNTGDGECTLSNDGLTLYIQRDQRFYTTTRSDPSSAAWSGVVEIPMDGNLYGYFGMDVGANDMRLVIGDFNSRLYEARPDASAWGVPSDLGIGGMFNDSYPSLRADGLEIFWQSQRSGTLATIWHATRPALDQPFTGVERIPLGPLDLADVGDPDISADGRTLTIVSNIADVNYNVYIVDRVPL